ncbi:EH domain-binding protein 1-like isoform X2 [Sycon ciliatum]|uniref:EH domain-binding protein 1-like isoform X2 n=1 Tax=Sycon ciliatum TaxID=27933 RepID=UPI0031F62AF6
MSLIWRRFQRTNKKAYKFEFTVTYKSLRLACADNQEWRPNTLVLTWKRRNRRFRAEALNWPNVEGMTSTILAWLEEESHVADIMMFKEGTAKEFDQKDWEFSLENITPNGQRKVIGTCVLNLVDCVEDVLCENELSLKLTPCTSKVKQIHLDIVIVAKFVSARKTSTTDDISLDSFTDDPAFEEQHRVGYDSDTSHELPSGPKSRVTVGGRRASSQSESKCVMEHKKTVTTARQKAEFLLHDDSDSTDNDDAYYTTPMSELPAMEIPGEAELLGWSRRVTNGYRNVHIKNMTTSWRSGLAFCAIIDRFRPGVIDFPGLSPLDVLENNKKAFKAAESIGVPRVLDPVELANCEAPDKLSIMTYVFQLKIHLSGNDSNTSDGATAVSHYSKQNREAIEQAILAEMRSSDAESQEDSPASEYTSDSSEDSDSSDYSSDDCEGDLVTGTDKWKVQRAPPPASDTAPAEDGDAAAQEDRPLDAAAKIAGDNSEDGVKNGNGSKTNGSSTAVKFQPQQDAQTAIAQETIPQETTPAQKKSTSHPDALTSQVKPAPVKKSMFDKLESDDSGSSPEVQVKSQQTPSSSSAAAATAVAGRLEDSDELERFTASGSVIAATPKTTHYIPKTPSMTSSEPRPTKRTAAVKLTPDLANYKSESPDAVRKLQLLARARKVVEEQERITGAAFVSPSTTTTSSSTMTSASSTAAKQVSAPANQTRQQPLASPKETDIDADICGNPSQPSRANPFNTTTSEDAQPTEKRKKKKKKKKADTEEQGEGAVKKKKKKKKKSSDNAGENEGEHKKKRKKKRKKAEGEEEDTSEPSQKAETTVCPPIAEEHVKSTAPASAAAAGQKGKRTRRVRKPLAVARPQQQAQVSAKDEVLKMRRLSEERKQEDGKITFQSAQMADSEMEGWLPAARSIPRSPTTESDFLDTFEYAHYSLKTIEKQQAELDKRGHRVEKRLRDAMSSGDQEATARLTQQWFQLIAQKNILFRQTEDLDLVSKETELESRFELINRKLRQLMAVEEHKKSADHVETEEKLMAEMKILLKQRDDVAHRLHEREVMAQQEDERVEKAISKTTTTTAADDEKQCVIC